MCRHLDHNTHSVGDIVGSTELWPVFPSNHFRPDYLVPCATPVHYLQVSAAKAFKASYLQMAKMAKEGKGNNRTHTNNLHCEALKLPVQLQIVTAHWSTLVVDCCIPHSTASVYLTTQNLTTLNFFFGKSTMLNLSQKSAQDQQSMDPKVPAVKIIVCIHSPTAITLSGYHF